MADVARILIVGGGIAGLMFARALHQRGFMPEVVEQSPSWYAVATGAGIAVQPNGLRMLDALGMGTGVAQAGSVIPRWVFCDEQGQEL